MAYSAGDRLDRCSARWRAILLRNVAVGRKFPALPQWLRITIGTPEETAAFLAALRAIVPARAAA